MDFNQFRKKSEDHKSVTMVHPDGHEFTLQKSKLTDDEKKHFTSMPFQNFADAGEVNVPRGMNQFAVSGDDANKLNNFIQPSPQEHQPIDANDPYTMAQQQKADQDASLQNVLPKVQPTQPPNPNIDLSTTNVTAGSGDSGMPDMPSRFQMASGYDKAIKGYNEEAAAKGEISEADKSLFHNQAADLQSLRTTSEENVKGHIKEMNLALDDLRNHQIDPQSYLHNRSTTAKIAHSIGLILGGIGGALTHQENPALKFLQSQIDRDVESQKANMNNKHSMISTMERMYGDKQSALDMYRALSTAKLENDINEQAAMRGDALSQARAKEITGPLQNQKYELLYNQGMKEAVMKGMQGGDPDRTMNAMRVLNPGLAKDMESRYIPGVGMATIPIGEKERGEMTLRNELDQKLQKLESFSKQNSGTLLNRKTVNEGNAMAQDVQDTYRRAQGQGVFREAESKFVNNMVSQDPTAFFANYRAMPGYEAVKGGNKMALKNLYKSYGIKANMPEFNSR